MRKLIPDLESAVCAFMSLLIVAAIFWAMSGNVYGQKKPDFTLTENQTLRLKVQQLQFSAASDRYQQAIASFNSEVKSIEKENGWPETLQFHPDSLTFNEADKGIAPTPAGTNAPAVDHGKPPKTPTPDEH